MERAMGTARKKVQGLPADFRYHDPRHYLASFLNASGADVKTVQERPRTPAPRPHSALMGTSGPTGMSRPAPPGRNRDGTVMRRFGDGAGQDPSMRQRS